ncbi:MAG: hypothetical protein FJY65_10940 [Calditrichaeota bacterium]|nr:hypothetical protein [Calditrichota bacterium]
MRSTKLSKYHMITFVGHRDPWAIDPDQSEGAIITACREYRPHSVTLIATPKTFEAAESTSKFLIEQQIGLIERNQIEIKTLNLDDPTDLSEIYLQAGNILKWVSERIVSEGTRFLACYASGTPQMRQVLNTLLEEGILPNVQRIEVRDPRYSGPRVYATPLNYAVESRAIASLKQLFDKYLFEDIVRNFRTISRITANDNRQKSANILASLFLILERWDKYDIKAAYQSIKKLNSSDLSELKKEWKSTLKDLHRAISENRENTTYLLDLYFTAIRRQMTGDYIGAMARYWHLWESIMSYILLVNYGVCKKLSKSINKTNAKKVKRYLVKNSSDFISGWITKKTLLEKEFIYEPMIKWLKSKIHIEDENFQKEISEWIDYICKKRNESIAGHGMSAISERDTHIAKVILTSAMTNLQLDDLEKEDLDHYPLNPKKLNQLSALFLKL